MGPLGPGMMQQIQQCLRPDWLLRTRRGRLQQLPWQGECIPTELSPDLLQPFIKVFLSKLQCLHGTSGVRQDAADPVNQQRLWPDQLLFTCPGCL